MPIIDPDDALRKSERNEGDNNRYDYNDSIPDEIGIYSEGKGD